MTKFIDYIKENPIGSTIISLAVFAIISVSLLQGCSLSDIIEVKIPHKVAVETNTKTSTSGKVSLNKAIQVRKRYVSEVKFNLEELDAGIEGGLFFHDIATSLLDTGLQLGASSAANVPGGAILFGALFGVGGLFFRKPGTAGLLKTAEDDGYDMGRKEALAGVFNQSTNNGS